MKKALILLLSLCTFATVQAQVVGANTQQGSILKPSKLIPEYRPTGGFMEICLGYPNATITVGNQLSSSVMIGGTFGFLFLEDSWGWERHEDAALPLFFTTRFSTPKYNFSLFAEAKVGIDIHALIDGYDFAYMPIGMLTAGFAWRNLLVSGGINLYYDEKYPNFYDSFYYESGLKTSLAVAISYRIPFETIRKVLL